MTEASFAIESPMFHVSHLIGDLFGAADRYVQLFDRAVIYAGLSVRHRRRAAFVLVGDVWLEIIASEGPGQRFLERFGDHLHGLAFYVRGIDALAEAMTAANMRFVDAAGKPAAAPLPRNGPVVYPRFGPTTPLTGGAESDDDWWSSAFYTQMDDAHGWYEFYEPKTRPNRLDPREVPGWRLTRLVRDPLAIVAGSHNTVVVSDVEKAVTVWTSTLQAQLLHTADNPALGTRSAFLRVGTGSGTVIEFAQPIAPGPAADDHENGNRDILHCVNFLVDDLDSVREHLASIGCGSEVDTEDLVVIDPSWCLGARYGFTTTRIPGSA